MACDRVVLQNIQGGKMFRKFNVAVLLEELYAMCIPFVVVFVPLIYWWGIIAIGIGLYFYVRKVTREIYSDSRTAHPFPESELLIKYFKAELCLSFGFFVVVGLFWTSLTVNGIFNALTIIAIIAEVPLIYYWINTDIKTRRLLQKHANLSTMSDEFAKRYFRTIWK